MNKSDLADPIKNKLWKEWFGQAGIDVIFTNAITGEGIAELKNRLKKIMQPKLESAAAKGRINKPIKTMIVGIPNVGKSAFINKLTGKAVAVTGDRPGVTRSRQWVRINPEIQLIGYTGILLA